MPMPNEIVRARVTVGFQCGEPRLRGGSGAKRARAGLSTARPTRWRSVRGKEGEDRVADDVEHLAALLHDSARGAIEIHVEQIEEGFDGKRVGKPGRVAQIAVPQGGGQPLAGAPLDEPGQDAATDGGP